MNNAGWVYNELKGEITERKLFSHPKQYVGVRSVFITKDVTMKNIILLAVLCLSALSCHAQKRAGQWSVIPRVGIAFANVSGEDDAYDPSGTLMDSKVKVGVVAGADVEYQLTDILAFSVGAYYQRLGSRYKDSDLSDAAAGTYTVWANQRRHRDYLSVPVMAHFYVSPKLLPGLAVNIGVQPQVKVNAKNHYEENEVTIGRDGSYTYNISGDELSEDSEQTKGFDFSIPVGLSYERQNVVIDLRYQHGLLNIYKEGNKGKNWAVVLSAGYRL